LTILRRSYNEKKNYRTLYPSHILITHVSLQPRMKYRGSTEIIDAILRSVRAGATKTHIMYRAYLSYAQLKGYLGLLEQRNLVTYDAASSLYKLTEKGMQFMNAYDQIHELVPNAVERNTSSKESVAPQTFNF
jgi:predicted transcriptional regulator